MTIKALLVRYILLAVCLVGLGAAHSALLEHVPAIARHYAPPYVPLVKEEANKRATETYKASTTNCDNPSDYMGEYLCKMRLTPSAPESVEQLERKEYESHRWLYTQREILPLQEKLETATRLGFGMLYFIIAISALILTWRSFKSSRLPGLFGRIQDRRRSVRFRSNLKDVLAGHRLRNAEDEFRALKNLHDNGLITDDMFAMRKEELRMKLDGNEIFRPKV